MKTSYIAVLFAAMLAASGCLCAGPGTTTEGTSTTIADETSSVGDTTTGLEATVTTQPKTNGPGLVGNTINSLKGAISAGTGYSCTYNYGGAGTTGLVKGQKYHFQTQTDQGSSHMVSDGKFFYMWVDGQTDGTMYNIEEMKALGGSSQSSGYQDVNAMDAGADNVNCKPAVISDSEFSKPSGIKFTDMGEMLKNLKGLQGRP